MTMYTEDIVTAPESETVCFCRQVTKAQLLMLMRQGILDLDELQRRIGTKGDRCAELSPRGRCCTPEIVRLLRYEKGMLPMA